VNSTQEEGGVFIDEDYVEQLLPRLRDYF
jgi:hypothetical protein